MSKKVTYSDSAKQNFISKEWGKDLFKYPDERRREERPEKERESCIRWLKRFLKKEWLPTTLSDDLFFIRGGIITRDWREKKKYSESGFVVRYALAPYLIQLEQTRTAVFVGVKITNSQGQVKGENRINFAVEIAKDIFQEGVVQVGGKELEKPHILEETDDLVWGWWSPGETRPLYDSDGTVIGYDLNGESPNQVVSVMFQTDGVAVRYEILKRLPPSEDVFGVGKKSPGDYRSIRDLVITEEKDATYVAFSGDRFFDTLWGGELFSFPGEEEMKKYDQPSLQEKKEITRQIEQVVKKEYLPSDIDQNLLYIPKGVKEMDWSRGICREKDGFAVRYLINSYLIQIEKTSSELFIGVKPLEMKGYSEKLLERIRVVREVAETVLKDGLVPKKDEASVFHVRVHKEDLTYGWWKPVTENEWLQNLETIEFQTDGNGVRFEIRSIFP